MVVARYVVSSPCVHLLSVRFVFESDQKKWVNVHPAETTDFM